MRLLFRKGRAFVDCFCLRPGRACTILVQLFLSKQNLGFCTNLESHYKNMFMPLTTPLDAPATPVDQSTGSSQSAPAIRLRRN